MAYIYDKIVREKNGQVLNITIQQVTPDLIEPVIDHMVDNFIEREPLCCHIDLINDQSSVECYKKLWRPVLAAGASIVALLDSGSAEPVVIGANITGVSRKSDPPLPELPGRTFNIAVAAVMAITKEANLWDRYGIDHYLTAYGLSVHRDYHGIGLGLAVLQAREMVCQIFKVPMTGTVFSAPASQHLASKLGYETVVEYAYSHFNNSHNHYKDLEGKINIMIKKYD